MSPEETKSNPALHKSFYHSSFQSFGLCTHSDSMTMPRVRSPSSNMTSWVWRPLFVTKRCHVILSSAMYKNHQELHQHVETPGHNVRTRVCPNSAVRLEFYRALRITHRGRHGECLWMVLWLDFGKFLFSFIGGETFMTMTQSDERFRRCMSHRPLREAQSRNR